MPDFYTIDPQFFIDYDIKPPMLDVGNSLKLGRRLYLCVGVVVGHNHFYLPLRKNLGAAVRSFGVIGHNVPSRTHPNAGLDYRHALIVNDTTYLHYQSRVNIPASQLKVINSDYAVICREFEHYVKKYIRIARKNRVSKEPLFRASSLVNFNDALGITLI